MQIIVILGHQRTDERFKYLINTYFQPGLAGIDVIMLDVIYSGDIGDHLLDFFQHPIVNKTALQAFDQDALQNNIRDGRLVALPLFINVGLLYYRKDLLAASGFTEPPKTWDEFEFMAATIQRDERQRRLRNDLSATDFWGYMFQGKDYEGVSLYDFASTLLETSNFVLDFVDFFLYIE